MFKLSAVLVGHTSDVKSVAAGPSGDSIVTGSRDNRAILFEREKTTEKVAYAPAAVVSHHNFVNAVASVPPSQQYPRGLIVSGGRENIVYVHDPSNPATPVFTLIGHTDNVCALEVSGTPSDPIILSGSWDKTAKIWAHGQCIQTLQGHQLAVWSVMTLSNGDLLTGSADKTIKLWRAGECIRTLTGHSDCVRGLAPLKNIGFVSCGNDASIRVWSAAGDSLQELYGHTAFVYAVDILSSGEIISCSEDRSVRIWKDGECHQIITHPAISVWCVKALPNGDIVSGSNDGVARVFTRSDERVAEESLIKQFDDGVQKFAIPKNQIGDMDKEKIPGEEALKVPGKSTGDVKVVRVGNNVEAFQWDAAQGKWGKIGDVVDAIGDSRKTTFQGKEYDYVFDVDLEDGLPPRKLPYNVSENPYTAAQNFIHREELSQTFLDEIARFIVNNTKGQTLGMGSAAPDPFTGGRYTGGSSSTPSYGGGSDPFTGSSSYSTQAPQPMDFQPTAPASAGYFPKRAFVFMEDAKLSTIVTKILEFNNQLPADQQKLSIDVSESNRLKKIAEALEQTNRYHSISFSENDFDLFSKLLNWPVDLRFPALDLFRIFILHPSAAEYYAARGPSFLAELLGAGCFALPASSKGAQNNQMLALRGLVNLFKFESGRKAIVQQRALVIEAVLPAADGDRVPLRQALATLFINFAVSLNSDKDEDSAMKIAVSVLEMLKREKDLDVTFRNAVALGTLVYSHKAIKDLYAALEAKDLVEPLSKSSDSKVATAAKALLELTK